jgi:hypothetical protein
MSKNKQPAKVWSMTLLIANVIGAAIYLLRSSPAWAIPEEKGLNSTTGEPFVWFIGILPVIVIFSLINIIWGSIIVKRHQWTGSRFWLLSAAIWLVAAGVDFAHH